MTYQWMQMDTRHIYPNIYIYIHDLIIYNFTLIFRLTFQFAKVFQFRRGTPLAFEKSASKIPKERIPCIQVWWQLYLCSCAQLWSFYRWSNVEAIKSDDLQNFRAKKKQEILQNEEVVLWSLDAVYCTQISLYTRSWQWHTRYVQEWFQERSSSRILNWRSSWDAAGCIVSATAWTVCRPIIFKRSILLNTVFRILHLLNCFF